MITVILRRLFIETVPSLFVIITLAFFMVRLAPGGPFSGEKNIAPQTLAALNAHYGLDKPLIFQYGRYVASIAHGDFGPSFKYPNRTVTELIGQSFPVSCELGIYALIFALAFGVTAGVIASLRPNRLSDYVPMSIAMAGICIPSFVLGPLLVLVFSLWLGMFNVWGWQFPRDRILPAITLGMAYVAYIARLTRAGMLEILSQDFIRTARAKGVSEFRVILVHALRGGLLPVVSFLGPATAGLITGSFVVETIFQIPGLGRFFVMAAFNRDYTMIMGTVIFYAILIIALNTIVDILLAV
ncbi:MAG TPA: ABC transporter permease subunit, partial [Chitinivibrionales bacterium]